MSFNLIDFIYKNPKRKRELITLSLRSRVFPRGGGGFLPIAQWTARKGGLFQAVGI